MNGMCETAFHFLFSFFKLSGKEAVDVHCKDSVGNTPLHCAAYRGHKQCVIKLLKSGASPTVKNNQGTRLTFIPTDIFTIPPCSNECICRLPEQTALDLVRTHELKQILLDFRDKVREMNHLVSLGVLCDLIGTKNKCLPLVSCVICMVCCCSTKIWYRLLQVYMDVKACRKAILQL